MKYLKPKKLEDYPLYIFLCWVILWILAIALSLIGIFMSKTPNGMFVQKFDRVYYYVPLQEEVLKMIINTGLIIGVATILTGYSWMLYISKRRTKKKRG